MHTKEKNLAHLIKLAIHHRFSGCSLTKEDFYLWFIGKNESTGYKNSTSNYEDLLSEKQMKKEIARIYQNSPEMEYGADVKGELRYEVHLYFENGVEDVKKSVTFYFKDIQELKMLLTEFNSSFKDSFYKVERWVCFKRYERGSIDRLESADPSLYNDVNQTLEFLDKKGKNFEKLQRRLVRLKKINSVKHVVHDQVKYALIYKILILGVLYFAIFETKIPMLFFALVLYLLLVQHYKVAEQESMANFYKELKDFCKEKPEKPD